MAFAREKNIYVATSSFKGHLNLRVRKEALTFRFKESKELELTLKEFNELQYPKDFLTFVNKGPVEKGKVKAPAKVETKEVETKVEVEAEPVDAEVEVVEEVKVTEEETKTEVEVTEEVKETVKPKTTRKPRKKSVKIETEENK